MAIFPVVQALPEPEQEILPEIQEPQEADREMKRKHVHHGHVPFANWCRDCVQAKGRARPHRRQPKIAEYQPPLVGLDYCFLGVHEHETTLPILAGHIMPSGACFSSVSQAKRWRRPGSSGKFGTLAKRVGLARGHQSED